MIQHTIAVLRDAFLDKNQAAITSLGVELTTFLKANFVGVDQHGVFVEFKYRDKLFKEYLFKLRYITTEQPFWMAEFPTTQEFYELVIGENPSYFKGLDLPVESVTFDNAIGFCEKLNLYFKIPKMKFDLPSEEEWLAANPYEYEGIDIEKDEDLKKVAWFYKNSNYSTQPVDKKQCNVNGLYEMLSNVWEWTITDYEAGKRKVFRGGSWCSQADRLSCTFRDGLPMSNANYALGFRLVLRST